MPEEINRVVVDHISTILFCPSIHAVQNLKKEGMIENVHYVGDVMYDLFLKMQNDFQYDIFTKLKLQKEKYILLTLHRDYNVDHYEILKKILKKLRDINKSIQIVFSIHPRTNKRIEDFNLKKYIKDLTVIPPCDYLNLMGLLKKSFKVITDSGGLQKEAYFAKKECALLMPDTGWVEIVNNKCSSLCDGSNLDEVLFMDGKDTKFVSGIYGDGQAGKKIVDLLINNDICC